MLHHLQRDQGWASSAAYTVLKKSNVWDIINFLKLLEKMRASFWVSHKQFDKITTNYLNLWCDAGEPMPIPIDSYVEIALCASIDFLAAFRKPYSPPRWCGMSIMFHLTTTYCYIKVLKSATWQERPPNETLCLLSTQLETKIGAHFWDRRGAELG